MNKKQKKIVRIVGVIAIFGLLLTVIGPLATMFID